jgi:hypothetical protein
MTTLVLKNILHQNSPRFQNMLTVSETLLTLHSSNIKRRSELNFFPSRSALIQFTNCYIITRTRKKENFFERFKNHTKTGENKKGTEMRKLSRLKCWWIFFLFFRCISGSIFNIRTGSQKVKVHTAKTFHLSLLRLVCFD